MDRPVQEELGGTAREVHPDTHEVAELDEVQGHSMAISATSPSTSAAWASPRHRSSGKKRRSMPASTPPYQRHLAASRGQPTPDADRPRRAAGTEGLARCDGHRPMTSERLPMHSPPPTSTAYCAFSMTTICCWRPVTCARALHAPPPARKEALLYGTGGNREAAILQC